MSIKKYPNFWLPRQRVSVTEIFTDTTYSCLNTTTNCAKAVVITTCCIWPEK